MYSIEYSYNCIVIYMKLRIDHYLLFAYFISQIR